MTLPSTGSRSTIAARSFRIFSGSDATVGLRLVFGIPLRSLCCGFSGRGFAVTAWGLGFLRRDGVANHNLGGPRALVRGLDPGRRRRGVLVLGWGFDKHFGLAHCIPLLAKETSTGGGVESYGFRRTGQAGLTPIHLLGGDPVHSVEAARRPIDLNRGGSGSTGDAECAGGWVSSKGRANSFLDRAVYSGPRAIKCARGNGYEDGRRRDSGSFQNQEPRRGRPTGRVRPAPRRGVVRPGSAPGPDLSAGLAQLVDQGLLQSNESQTHYFLTAAGFEEIS